MKMSTYLHSFAFAAAVLVSTAAYSSVLYVDSLADESADGDGASPETALATLDAAAAAAADGDEIRILGGKGRCRRACVCHWLLNTGCWLLPLLGDWSWGEGEVFAAKNALSPFALTPIALNSGNPVKTDPRTRPRFLENNS